MSGIRSQLKARFFILAGLLLANAVIILADVSWLRLPAGIALVFVLPGLAWLLAFGWFETRCGIERIVLVGGMSAAISAAALLAAVYWPGPWTLVPTLITLDLVTLVGAVLSFLRPRRQEAGKWVWPPTRVAIALVVILGVAIFLRWYNIGYAEFHEDELENMRLIVRAMRGEEYAPFLDSKGPIHWLLPGSLWLMHGWINETIARLPFAISSTSTVLAVYALGRRMAGPIVGLIGSGFVAVSGLLVAYARHLENSSLIVLWAVLAAWCAYRFYRERIGSLQVLGALFLGIGLVAHPNMILYVLPFAFMIGFVYWQDKGLWRQQWKSLVLSLALFMVLTLVFYVPFVRDPNFLRTLEYFAEERIGVQFLYNRAVNLFELEGGYSTRYYMPLVILFSSILFARELRKLGSFGVGLAAFIGVAIATTLFWPSIWEWGPVNGAFLPYALLFLTLTVSPRTSFEVKSLTLWFGIPYLALAFLAQDASTHIRNAYPAWFLITAMGYYFLWSRLSGRLGQILKIAGVLILACILGLIVYYEYLQFLGRVTDYWRAEADAKYNPASIYRTLYGELPRPRKLVSNPRLGGWKVVGQLYDTGQLSGDFRSIGESFAVPIWYTHQTPRSCFNDPQNYFVRIDPRGEPEEMADLPAAGYGVTRVVRIDHQPKLYLFEKGTPPADEPLIYDVDDYRGFYDRSATPGRYVQGPFPQHLSGVTFGGKLLLQGYDLSSPEMAAGETLNLTLHWQAIAPMETRYRTFVHVETDRMWGQHDDDPICRLRTDELRPSQTGAGQFRVTLDPATPPGVYPVTVGVYDPDTWERMQVIDAQGQPLGDALELTAITVR